MSENQLSRQPITSPSPARSPSCEPSVCKTSPGSHEEKLFQFVLLLEEVLFERWQNLDGDPAHNDERMAMKAIADDLWAIKIRKLGWPDPNSSVPPAAA
jgi:hypothetical protein